MPRAKIKKRLRPAKISATGVDFNESLPSIEGPQLGPFRHRNSIIEFVSLLSDESLGSYSHVFEVVIESKHYALKMVRSHLDFYSRKPSW